MNYNHVLCIGDSITYGSRDEFNSSYPLEMESILEKKTKSLWLCHNEGIPGETTSDVVRRFYNVLKKYAEAKDVCFFEGTNDAKDSITTTPENYRRNLMHCIKSAKIVGRDLYLGTIPMQRGPEAPGYSKRTNERVIQYNRIIRRLSKQNKIPLVDLSDLAEDFYSDGIHFNNAGHKEIARRFAYAILENRSSSKSTTPIKKGEEL